MIISLYQSCLEIAERAKLQGKPEWALSKLEARAIRHLRSLHANFVLEEIPVEENHPEQ